MSSQYGYSNDIPIPSNFTQTVELRGTGAPYCRIVLTVRGQDRTAKWQTSTDGQHWSDHDGQDVILAGQTWTLTPDGNLIGRV